jgi:tripartite-type tricarboxylate transporter receptor subunit TctC
LDSTIIANPYCLDQRSIKRQIFEINDDFDENASPSWGVTAMRVRAAATICFAVLTFAPAAHADAVADFYRGKQLRLVVGSAVGGGYDLYARALARELGKHIPGGPSIVVQNLPGAAGMVMVNQLYNQGPHDGTVIGASLNGIPTAPLLQSGAKFDPAKLNWLGSLAREAYVAYVWHTAPVSDIRDMKKQEILVGATTAGTTMVDYPLLLNDLLGYKFKVVRGYQGPPQVNLAIERGEVQGNGGLGYATVKSLTQKWLDEKKIKILVQYNFERVPELKGVPLVTELAVNESQRQAMRLVFARAEYSRPFVVSQDVPKERVTALRRAFDATAKDPAFLAEARKLKLDISPMSGEAMQALVADLAKTPPQVIARVKAALIPPAAK